MKNQYCSRQYQALLRKHGFCVGVRVKGNCYDNASAESLFPSLKREESHGAKNLAWDALLHKVFEYFEVDYNRTRQNRADRHHGPAVSKAIKSCLTACLVLRGKIINQSAISEAQ